MRSLLATSLVTSFVASTLLACSLASPTYITTSPDPLTEDDAGTTSSSSSSSSSSSGATPAPAGTCATDDWDKPDTSKLTACGNGKGHCIDKAKTDLASILEACADASQVCVPDEIVSLGGGKLKSCKVEALSGAPGGCVNLELIPQMKAQGGGALKQDVCDAGLVCAPCTDPIHGNAPTPFCAAEGVHKNACTTGSATGDGGTTTPAAVPCCTAKTGKSNGVCIAASAVPAANKDDVKQLECASGNMCVPAAMAGGNPVKCDAGFLGKGVCMDKCFNDMMSMAGGIGILDSDGCGSSTELCIPCSMASMGGTKVPGCE